MGVNVVINLTLGLILRMKNNFIKIILSCSFVFLLVISNRSVASSCAIAVGKGCVTLTNAGTPGTTCYDSLESYSVEAGTTYSSSNHNAITLTLPKGSFPNATPANPIVLPKIPSNCHQAKNPYFSLPEGFIAQGCAIAQLTATPVLIPDTQKSIFKDAHLVATVIGNQITITSTGPVDLPNDCPLGKSCIAQLAISASSTLGSACPLPSQDKIIVNIPIIGAITEVNFIDTPPAGATCPSGTTPCAVPTQANIQPATVDVEALQEQAANNDTLQTSLRNNTRLQCKEETGSSTYEWTNCANENLKFSETGTMPNSLTLDSTKVGGSLGGHLEICGANSSSTAKVPLKKAQLNNGANDVDTWVCPNGYHPQQNSTPPGLSTMLRLTACVEQPSGEVCTTNDSGTPMFLPFYIHGTSNPVFYPHFSNNTPISVNPFPNAVVNTKTVSLIPASSSPIVDPIQKAGKPYAQDPAADLSFKIEDRTNLPEEFELPLAATRAAGDTNITDNLYTAPSPTTLPKKFTFTTYVCNAQGCSDRSTAQPPASVDTTYQVEVTQQTVTAIHLNSTLPTAIFNAHKAGQDFNLLTSDKCGTSGNAPCLTCDFDNGQTGLSCQNFVTCTNASTLASGITFNGAQGACTLGEASPINYCITKSGSTPTERKTCPLNFEFNPDIDSGNKTAAITITGDSGSSAAPKIVDVKYSIITNPADLPSFTDLTPLNEAFATNTEVSMPAVASPKINNPLSDAVGYGQTCINPLGNTDNCTNSGTEYTNPTVPNLPPGLTISQASGSMASVLSGTPTALADNPSPINLKVCNVAGCGSSSLEDSIKVLPGSYNMLCPDGQSTAIVNQSRVTSQAISSPPSIPYSIVTKFYPVNYAAAMSSGYQKVKSILENDPHALPMKQYNDDGTPKYLMFTIKYNNYVYCAYSSGNCQSGGLAFPCYLIKAAVPSSFDWGQWVPGGGTIHTIQQNSYCATGSQSVVNSYDRCKVEVNYSSTFTNKHRDHNN